VYHAKIISNPCLFNPISQGYTRIQGGKAEQIYLQMIEISKAIHGPDDIHTLHYQFSFARIYRHQKRYEEAKETMIHVVETFKSLIGSKDSWIMIYLTLLLFYLYIDWGDIHKAEEAWMQLVECGERNPEFLVLGLGKFISDTQKILHMKKQKPWSREETASLNKKVANTSSTEHSVTELQTESSHSA
jgi:tetratricopeptide (TPR) repeat protein